MSATKPETVRIVALNLALHDNLTRASLARGARVSVAVASRSIKRLLADGLIRHAGVEPPIGRAGRGRTLYCLSRLGHHNFQRGGQ